ncbi:MAG TPA: hypothetical protein VLQ45_33290 [Thermoanaerobaculia bacterium]|nr:hypothetical protein [Thermoanaerobaculia bacterium]
MAVHRHLDTAGLEDLVLLNGHKAQKRFLLDALGLCPECARVGEHLLAAREAGWLPEDYGILEAELARSRFEAPALWEKLARYSPEKRRGLIQDTDRFLSWGLCELLCRQSREVTTGDAVQAVELAELAVLVADRLPANRPFEPEWLCELRALAWAYLGNARRVLGELRSAEEAFSRADELWTKGEAEVGDPLGYGPVILDLQASLLRDQRRFREAVMYLDQVVAAYRDGRPEVRDTHLAGRALVNKAYTLDQMGEPERALEALREAAPLVDSKRDPRLFLCLQHNLLLFLTNLGRHREAAALLPKVDTLTREVGNALDLVRLRWAEGRIAAGLGQTARAVELFQSVRQDFLTQGIGYDAALVSLELAALYAREGKTAEMKELAGEMLPVFQSRDVHREALAALAVFQQAVAREAAGAELVGRVAAFLDRARHDPGLRFDAEGGASA